MGLLRFLLAIGVVIDHAGPVFGYRLLDGKIAVELFFIISGFYMSLILREKYSGRKNSYWLFLSNRFLRIYPCYFFILLLTLLLLFFQHNLSTYLATIPLWERLIKNTTLFFTGDYFWYSAKSYGGLYIFQAWTLGMELLFYFCAPFLSLLNNRKLVALTLVSFLLRILFTHFLIFYPIAFIDRFFLIEIGFFLAGMLAYRGYVYCKQRAFFGKVSTGIWIAALLFTILFPFFPFRNVFANNPFQLFYLACMTVCIPAIFSRTKKLRWDRALGNLSYPIYISHAILIDAAKTFFPTLSQGSWFSIVMIVMAVLFAISLEEFLLHPIEQFRQRRAKSSV